MLQPKWKSDLACHYGPAAKETTDMHCPLGLGRLPDYTSQPQLLAGSQVVSLLSQESRLLGILVLS